ncbi:MAG: alpha/beta fold hydrolase [Myxococcota bacterium]|nr:alpha/beta fold hydrolase [Myxococcota bacterium]
MTSSMDYRFKSRRFYSHFWTLYPHVSGLLKQPQLPFGTAWCRADQQASMDEVFASGIYHPVAGANELAIVIHGLGSGPDASYVEQMAFHCIDAGISVLRLALRGADQRAPDFYNAAFIDDVRTALSDPEMARYGRRYLIGFSLGGHVSLWAALKLERCIAGVVAICPPLDLKQCQTVLDSPTINVYRSHCLKGLKRTVRAAKKRADNLGYELNIDLDCLNQIKTIYQWDDLVIAPRFGYRDASDYYERCSVGPHLAKLKKPALIIATTYDPMVPVEAAIMCSQTDYVTIKISDEGGHVGFPKSLNLDIGQTLGLGAQVITWLRSK